MSKYIPHEKMCKLREAAKNGDEKARKILMAQLSDDDFSADLDLYFKPPVEEESVEEVAESSPIENKQEETQDIQDKGVPAITGKPENPEISNGILNLMAACDRQTIEIANNPDISDATKKGALSIIQEIKQSCLDNLEKFGKLMSSISKKSVDEEM